MVNPLGLSFGESISGNKKSRPVFSWEKSVNPVIFGRLYLFILILLIGLGLLLARLFSLTVIEGSSYKKLSQGNRIRELNLPAPRGIIYDRNRHPLVRNIPTFSDLNGDVYLVKPQTNNLLIEGSTREYIYNTVFAQVLGYVGEVSPEELNLIPALDSRNKLDKVYSLKDSVGKMGLEKSYDNLLRGIDGKELFESDSSDKYIRTLGRVDPKSGQNLYLNLDLTLQEKAAELLTDKKGAVVASVPQTGEILALYSSPTFDPNAVLKGENLSSIFDNPDNPLFNRAIQGLYPPGSTFKIVTALAALSSGKITAKTEVEDVGILEVGNYSYGNWYFTQYGKTEGQVDMVKALRRSNDIFFYKIGEIMGIEHLAKWGKIMGIGRPLGIDIEGEEKGLMPDPIWRQKIKNENWFLGNTYHTAIGQGDILVTPLQVNFWTNVIANQGFLCTPKLAADTPECRDLGIKKENLAIVREGLREACSEGGTGYPLFHFKVENEHLQADGLNFLEAKPASGSAQKTVEIPVLCKTGTAEFGDPENKTHAWFTVSAPSNDPQITVTVLIEKGGEGSSVAAPLARELLKVWFER